MGVLYASVEAALLLAALATSEKVFLLVVVVATEIGLDIFPFFALYCCSLHFFFEMLIQI
jgi:hypothetical protein